MGPVPHGQLLLRENPYLFLTDTKNNFKQNPYNKFLDYMVH